MNDIKKITIEDILKSKEIFGLGNSASINEIKEIYLKLSHKYHPDKCKENDCLKKMADISNAYEVLKTYAMNYRLGFSKNDIADHLSIDQWWKNKFGSDPLWGGS